MSNPKILLLDIETAPAVVYSFQMYKTNIGMDQVLEPGRIICVGAKWFGERESFMFSEWEHGQREMLLGIHEMMQEADAVVTYNGDKFDLPKLAGQFLKMGFDPTPPATSIDVVKSVRKLGYDMNRLGFIGPLLGLGKKMEHEGFPLWSKVMDGDSKAQRRMEKYCIQDVKLLEKLYRKIRPFIKNHPHLGKVKAHACGACGSTHIHSRGYRRTRAFRIQRLQCQSCGSWQDGKKEGVK